MTLEPVRSDWFRQTRQGVPGNGDITSATLSGDGRVLAIASAAANLTADDNNAVSDIFTQVAPSNGWEVVSVPSPNLPSETTSGFTSFSLRDISADGRYALLWVSGQDVPQPGGNSTVLLRRDLLLQTNAFINVTMNGIVTTNGRMRFPPGSAAMEVRWCFPSTATNLHPLSATNREPIYLRDIKGRQTYMVTINSPHTAPVRPDHAGSLGKL